MIEQLAISLDQMNEKQAAVTLLDALNRNSKAFAQFDELAKSYFKIKEYEKAYQTAEKALSLYNGTDLYSVKYNTLNTANHANYPERAMTLIKQLELISPDDIDLQMEKAFALFLLNQKDKAEEVLRTQLANPKVDEKIKTKIRFNLGTYELLRDEFQSGLRKFLFEGRKLDFWKKPVLPFTAWDGKIHKDKTIYIRTEAGIGDEFINIRFMNHLKELGMKPIWYTERKDLAKVFNRNGYDAVTDILDVKTQEDIYWVHSMDLPIYLNLQYNDLWNGQYLRADQEKVEKWKQFFSKQLDKAKPIIGIRWQGNPSYDQDLHRSIPLSDIMSVLPKDANLVSIQRDTGLDEIKSEYDILDLSKYMSDFEETLAILENLDILITSCTSVGHASAAMNKRTAIITPISAYYTWCHSTEKSPWYGSNLTLLRQEKPRVWKEPLDKLKEMLDAEFSA
jgi:tetratricopeptide (TPR) repeat protein